MTLRVIDVSANQGLINIAPIDCDAVIVKGTGGNNYVNDCCDFVLQQCFKLNKPAGLISEPAREPKIVASSF